MALVIPREASQDEQFKLAASYAGVDESVLRAQWRVESGEGTNMRSPAGARGHFQHMPETQATFEARLGRKFNPDDFTDSLTMAGEVMRENMGLAKGNVADALRWYNAGNPTRWNNPETQEYVAKVLGNDPSAGSAGMTVSAADVRLEERMSLAEAWVTSASQLREKSAAATGSRKPVLSNVEKGVVQRAALSAAVQNALTGKGPGAAEVRAAAQGHERELATAVIADEPSRSRATEREAPELDQQIAQQAEQRAWERARDDEVTMGDRIASAFRRNGTGELLSFLERNNDPSVRDPGFVYTDFIDQIEGGLTMDGTGAPLSLDEVHKLRSQAHSMADVRRLKAEIIADRHNDEKLTRGGNMAEVLTASLLGGIADPVGILAGFGVMKGMQVAGVSARAAFMSGQTTKGFALAGAEGVAGNVLVTGAIDAMAENQTAADYAMAGGFGLLFGSGFGAFDYLGTRAAAAAQQEMRALAASLQQDAAAANVRLYAEAQERAGAGATPEQIQQQADIIAREGEMQLQEVILSGVPEADRFFPRPDVQRGQPLDMPGTNEAPTAGASDLTTRLFRGHKIPESRAVRAIVDSAVRSGSVRQALDALSKSSAVTPDQRALAARLAPIMEDLNIKMVTDHPDHLWGGGFDSSDNTMWITQARPDILLHEAVHAATVNLMRNAKLKAKMPGVKLAMQEMGDILDHARAFYRDNLHDVPNLDRRVRELLETPAGPLSSNEELIAYGMTDLPFREYLRSIPAPAGREEARTAWDWFKDMIADMLGITEKGERNTLDALIETSGDLLDMVEENPQLNVRGADVGEAAAGGDNMQLGAGKVGILPNAVNNTRAKRKKSIARWGLQNSIHDDAERIMVAEIYERASLIASKLDPKDPRLAPLLKRVGWEASSTTLLSAENPVLRAVGMMLLENPEGVAGRSVTAAMRKVMLERRYVGNAIREYESLYAMWRNRNGGSRWNDHWNTQKRQQFDQEVYAARDRRFNNVIGEEAPEVKAVADMLDASYNRMRSDQKYVGTIGSARLADADVRGYQPRMMAAGVVANLTRPQQRALLMALSEEMQVSAGYDKDFADKFAVQYLERAKQQAQGAYEVPMNLHSAEAADMVRDALRALSMNEEDIAKVAGRFSRGGAKHTKARIDMDLTRVYDIDGQKVRLMDIMNTDNLGLLRQYARRTSGEVALAQWGIMGEQGVKELRKAVEVAMRGDPNMAPATKHQMEAFDQVMGEFLGKPVGKQLGKWADNARSFTSSLRLGGMGFNQFAEYANAVGAIGVTDTMKAVADIPRLLGEVRKLAAGEHVDNSILRSMETAGLGDFGMDGYRLRGMYDVNEGFEVYGQEQLTVVDRTIRAGAHFNRVLSMHRATTAVQIRGMAEQITMKALRYIRDGVEDKALADMGFDAEFLARLRPQIEKAAKFDASGNVIEFDNMAWDSPDDALRFMASVQRGASQIIQEAYIGETGKWAHDGWLKLLTQFRSYGLTAVQKQFRRQQFTHGTFKVAGLMMGAMSVAIPIHLARLQLRALAMPEADREEFMDRNMAPMALARASLNYISTVGILPDVLDIAATAAGMQPSGGRANNQALIGGQVLPAVGAIEDVYKLAKAPGRMSARQLEGKPLKAGDEAVEAMRLLPGSNFPVIQAFFNVMKSED